MSLTSFIALLGILAVFVSFSLALAYAEHATRTLVPAKAKAAEPTGPRLVTH